MSRLRLKMTPQTSTVLVIDAGNTRIKFGVCQCHDPVHATLPICERVTAVPRDEELPWDVLREILQVADNSLAVVTGSHPPTIDRVQSEWPQDLPHFRVLVDRGRLPIKIDVEFPERVGIDRLLTAIAANVVRTAGEPILVVDTGTAVTVNAISGEGTFVGGAILPGLELAARALHQYTALLPELQLNELLARVPDVIGRHTEAAIASGLYWGQQGAVRELVGRMGCALSGNETLPPVLLTGGAARLWTHELPDGWTHEPHLTLQGMAHAAMMVPDLFGPAS